MRGISNGLCTWLDKGINQRVWSWMLAQGLPRFFPWLVRQEKTQHQKLGLFKRFATSWSQKSIAFAAWKAEASTLPCRQLDMWQSGKRCAETRQIRNVFKRLTPTSTQMNERTGQTYWDISTDRKIMNIPGPIYIMSCLSYNTYHKCSCKCVSMHCHITWWHGSSSLFPCFCSLVTCFSEM